MRRTRRVLANDLTALRLVISALLEQLGGEATVTEADLTRMESFGISETHSALGRTIILKLTVPSKTIQVDVM